MKLHLPSSLRKALLACLAALASHRRFPRTVSTGTALLGVFTMLWSTSSRAAAQSPQALPGDVAALLSETDARGAAGDEPSAGIPSIALAANDGIATIAADSAGDASAPGTAPETEEVALDVPSWLGEADEDEEQNLLAANSEEETFADISPIALSTDGVMLLASGDPLTWTGAGNAVTLSSSGVSTDDSWNADADSLTGQDVVLAGTGTAPITVTVGSGSAGSISMQSLIVGGQRADHHDYGGADPERRPGRSRG